jgi:hypothetical protein
VLLINSPKTTAQKKSKGIKLLSWLHGWLTLAAKVLALVRKT